MITHSATVAQPRSVLQLALCYLHFLFHINLTLLAKHLALRPKLRTLLRFYGARWRRVRLLWPKYVFLPLKNNLS